MNRYEEAIERAFATMEPDRLEEALINLRALLPKPGEVVTEGQRGVLGLAEVAVRHYQARFGASGAAAPSTPRLTRVVEYDEQGRMAAFVDVGESDDVG